MKNSPRYAARKHRKQLRRRIIAPAHQGIDRLIQQLGLSSDKADKARRKKLIDMRASEKATNYRKHHMLKVAA